MSSSAESDFDPLCMCGTRREETLGYLHCPNCDLPHAGLTKDDKKANLAMKKRMREWYPKQDLEDGPTL